MRTSFECDLKWDELQGDSHTRRHCQVCDHDVFNLSGMTKDQAQRVLELHRGRKLCARYLMENGRIMHGPDVQLRNQRVGAGKLLAMALVAQGAFLGAVAFDSPGEVLSDTLGAIGAVFFDDADGSKFTPQRTEVMGSMVTF